MARKVSGRIKKKQSHQPQIGEEIEKEKEREKEEKERKKDHTNKLMRLVMDMKHQAIQKHLKAKQARDRRLHD